MRRKVRLQAKRTGEKGRHSFSKAPNTALPKTSSSPISYLMFLQQTVGNQAVRRILDRSKGSRAEAIAKMGLQSRRNPLQNRDAYRSSLGSVVDSVHVHTGPMAQKACETFGIQAYSYEGNIVLRSPHASSEIIGHEVYHAANQKHNTMDASVNLSEARDPSAENGANVFSQRGLTINTGPAGSQSRVPRLSFYTKKTFGGKGFRLSNDEYMAVRQDTNVVAQNTFYGSKHFYSKPALIGSSHTTLKAQKSALELKGEPGVTLTVRAGTPARSLSSPLFMGDPRLEAIMRKKTSKYIRWGSRGTAVKKIQRALIDAGHPLPKYGPDSIAKSETVSAIKSFQRSARLPREEVDGIVGPDTLGLLDKKRGGGPRPAVPPKILHRVSAKNVNSGTEGLSMEIVDDCGGAAKTVMMGRKPGFNTAAPQGGNNIKGVYKKSGIEKYTPVYTTSKQVRDYVIRKVMGKANATDAMNAYWSNTQAQREIIDKNAGINTYANVQTGESHSIVRGDSIGWNWHWGAVIMRSGSDVVTLENFAGSGVTAWDFQMYGASGAQSFHKEQKQRKQSDLTTPEYGHKPITVRIKPA